jgi:hypothetical protein
MYYQRGGRISRDGRENNVPSIQDKLTNEEIQEKLQNYIEVSDIDAVPINTHVRYYVKQGQEYKFRIGGFLKKKDNQKYVVLSTSPDQNGKTWSVNRATAEFYRIKTKTEQLMENAERENEDLLDKYQTTLQNQQKEIKKLRQSLERAKKNK